MELFHYETVGQNITKISDLSGVHAYLIEGSEKAALIDTCLACFFSLCLA